MQVRPLVTFPRRVGRRLHVELTGYRLARQPSPAAEDVVRSALGAGADLATTVRALGSSDRPLRFFATSEPDAVLETLERLAPGYADRVTQDADRLCDRAFRILGADVVNLGSGRSGASEGSVHSGLPWHEDFLTGYRWNPRRYHM